MSDAIPCVRCGKAATLRCPKCIEVCTLMVSIATSISTTSHLPPPLIFCRPCYLCSFPARFGVQVLIPELESSFCSQSCFKEGWAEHKSAHTDPTRAWLYAMNRGASRTRSVPAFDYRGPLRPHPISPPRTVPDHIPRPDYAGRDDGMPVSEMQSKQQRNVQVFAGKELEGIRTTCRLAREVNIT